MRTRMRLFLWIPIFFFSSLILTGGEFEDKEIQTKENVFILSWEGNEIKIFLNGDRKTYICDEYAKEEKADVFGDLVLRGERVLYVKIKEEKLLGTVIEVGEDTIYLKDFGEIALKDKCKVYRKERKSILYEMPKEQLLGEEKVTIFLEENKAAAILALGEQQEKELRVAIGKDKTSSMFHEGLSITSDSTFFLISGEERKTYKKNETVILEENDFWDRKYLEVVAKEKGKIKIESRGEEKSKYLGEYDGKIEFHFERGKGIVAIQSVSLEEYTRDVCTDKRMDESLETAKVKAVCVRTEAARAWYEPAFARYGVHIVDEKDHYKKETVSKLYQKAVKETEGEVIRWMGEPIRTNIYLISAGTTSDVRDVWVLEKRDYFYLKGHLQNREKHWANLSKEEDFMKFINGKDEKDFEYGNRYYRWWVNLTFRDLSEHIEKNLTEQNPQSISVLEETSGTYKRKAIKTIGDVKNVRVIRRSKGGIIEECEIEGEKETIRVSGEQTIRKILYPEKTIIFLEDGESEQKTALPSAYFGIQKAKGGIRLIGGGYGSGVGVSEIGALALAEEKWNYKDILGYYFLLDIDL